MANLSTMSRTDLEAMGKKEFLLSLQSMSPEAVKRFKSMRKLPDGLAHELDGYLVKIEKAAKKRPAAPAKRTKSPVKPKPKPAAKPKHKAEDNYVPFPDRFKAWWNGTDLPHGKDATIQTKQRQREKAATAEKPNQPDYSNIDWQEAIRERVWGKDFALPGGAGVIMSMAKTDGLAAGEEDADILPGCLGPARALSKVYDVTVTSMVTQDNMDTQNAKHLPGQEIAKEDTQVVTSLLDLGRPDFGLGAFDKIFCREVMCLIPEREAFLTKTAGGLRGGGRFVFYDVISMGEGPEPEEVKTWRELEPKPPHLWTVSEYTKHLFEARLETKSTADMTKSYISLVEADWRRVMAGLETDPLPREGVDALMEEGRAWQARIAALKTGRIGLVRFVTTPKTIRSLSGPS
ncbi:MAG: hypothetical protein ACFB0Z_06125 [Candidatus Phaeomarinobacter sp.]